MSVILNHNTVVLPSTFQITAVNSFQSTGLTIGVPLAADNPTFTLALNARTQITIGQGSSGAWIVLKLVSGADVPQTQVLASLVTPPNWQVEETTSASFAMSSTTGGTEVFVTLYVGIFGAEPIGPSYLISDLNGYTSLTRVS